MSGRIIGYARVSTMEQHLEAQIDRLRKAGADPVFADHGESGVAASRPQWDACLAALRPGDTLISTKLDRFGRSVAHLVQVIPDLEKRGVGVRCLDQPIDTTTAMGKMLFTILAAFAEFERNLIAERVREAKRYSAAQGKVARRRSFGFEDDGTTPRPAEVLVIRELASRLLAGESQYDLETELRERGIVTIGGSPFTREAIRKLMTRPRNAGYLVHDGAPVARLPGEPILDQTTHDRLIAMFAARKPGRQPSGRYLLTGMAVCGRCGHGLTGRPVTGTPRRRYLCRECLHTFVDVGPLDTWVLDWAIRVLSDPKHADALARADEERAKAWERLTAEEAAIEATLVDFAGRLGRQEISLARHDAVANPLDARLREIAQEREQLTAEQPEPMPPGLRTLSDRDKAWLGWLEVATEGTVAERRAMVLRALAGRKITIGPGKPARFDPSRVTIA